ncbi:hypothetical protein [Streptomyces sp. NPDC048663]|uniref:hypothetical protein n=1 Tax=Streptomyces sp. NPDC048663 TaxID=3155638 RepID=UPI003420C6BF
MIRISPSAACIESSAKSARPASGARSQSADAVRRQVYACGDLDRLESWAQRAMHVTDAAQLFAPE